jgi:hypothetical protein
MEKKLFTEEIFERKKELDKLLSRENETYAKLELPHGEHGKKDLCVKGIWYPTHFIMFVLDGQDTWTINGMIKIWLKDCSLVCFFPNQVL